MRTQSKKAKGRRLQQDVCKKLLNTFPDLQEDDVQSRSMGAQGEDVMLSPKARELFPFSVECKNQESLNIWKALEQAGANAKDYTPLVIFKRNRSETYASLKLDDLLRLLGKDGNES